MTWTLLHGDCRAVLATMDDASVDAVVTDPPYDLTANKKGGTGEASVDLSSPYGRARITAGGGFMGQQWDATGIAFDPDLWAEVLRVLKPGGHLLAFGGTRTYHRMTVAIEDAGFEVRDSIHWVYGSGFPKSLDVSKAIDKAAGAEREVVGVGAATCEWIDRGEPCPGHGDDNGRYGETVHAPATAPATDAARQWDGWGTALKPAHEPIVVARKPLAGTVAATVLEHGTGALNIDGCRVAGADAPLKWETPRGGIWQTDPTATATTDDRGRWPANFVLTHAADCGDDCAPGCPVAALDEQSGDMSGAGSRTHRVDRSPFASGEGDLIADRVYGDSGGASRFFTVTEWDDAPFRYVAKPSRAERNAGTDRNIHPTVKPLDLMRWLVRLVTPPGGVVLDPFAGSGTTLAATILEGFDCVGVEMTDDYLSLIEGRCTWAEKAARFGPVTGRPKAEQDDHPTLFDVEDDK